MLYLVPTPIGNLDDMTVRAIKILQKVDLILAEDTRTSGHLIKHYQIETRMSSYHAYNEHKKLQDYMNMLKKGINIALITDAGTPGISDPGFLLVRECRENNLKVQCLPGANAIIPAVAASGIACDKFYFEGFLPHKKGRQTRHKYLCELPYTFVMYESPHRLIKCLKELKEHCGGGRKACVVRELTKIYEEYNYKTVDELLEDYESRPSVKGEIVVVVAGKSEKGKT